MKKRIFSWLGGEFIELSGEARLATSIEEETVSLFQSFEQELKAHGLSLENTVRTRLWGKTGKQEISALLRAPRF